MEIALTEGQFNLVPIDGEEPGTRAGYYFRFTDPQSGISLVAPLPHEQAAKLGAALVADTDEHPAGSAGGGAKVEVFGDHHLKAVKTHVPPPRSQP